MINPTAFWSHVNQHGPVRRFTLGECWVWTGRVFHGHGTFTCGHHNLWTHRVAWNLTNGPIPKGQNVNHLCGNGTCVRPSHLYLGNQKDNYKDQVHEGKIITGPKNGKHTHPEQNKLTPSQIREIRSLAGKITHREIANRFGISRQHVASIIHKRVWAWVA